MQEKFEFFCRGCGRLIQAPLKPGRWGYEDVVCPHCGTVYDVLVTKNEVIATQSGVAIRCPDCGGWAIFHGLEDFAICRCPKGKRLWFRQWHGRAWTFERLFERLPELKEEVVL